ncbi:NAD(P)/FAD-dependent oxidoreductase [Paenibacillus gorillae]|uniref:NAD(P)/FAD-dependent oxidoreductase n=1 Tax=Paenibacillus gorillae TaxID=1243662 RepID=UPI0005A709BF|nr:NAD(FAD)-utilizing dehydrogenase [Paenibacillus gorillae]
MDYDVTIIGAGVGGVFAAHELAKIQERRKGMKPLNILLIDKGKRVEERFCPLDLGESCSCAACAKYIGFGGLGKSEGKFNYTNDFGGGLERKVGSENAMALMDEVDAVLCEYGGAAAADYSTENPVLTERARQAGLAVLTTRTRHLGSALSTVVLEKLQRYLLSRIILSFETDVAAIQLMEGGGFKLELDGAEGRRMLTTRKLVFATGRSGADWMAAQCQALGIGQDSVRVDLGLRVEMRGNQLDAILGETFETKLQYVGEDYMATTYCMNPSGRVIRKHQDGMVMPDGQNFREREGEGSANLNFTLFVPRYFDSMEAADSFARGIISGINRGGERIVAQRLEDLKLGRATEQGIMQQNRVKPTLQVDPGQLADEVPELYTKALLDFLAALERLLGEPIDEDTMVYGIDGKFYAPSIETNEALETRVPGLYAAGDCSGVTHSLSQAAASGIHVARQLARQLAGELPEVTGE